MLWQVKNPSVAPEYFEVLFRFAIFKLAYLSLCQTQPAPQEFLIESLAEKLKMARMVAVCLENFPYVLAFEG
jgi:hypothetical protein